VAIAVRNRWRRQQLRADLARDVIPKNILMIGPTGVGKTEIARRLATLVKAPFIKVEATKYTEVGYVGRDVESMIRDLLEIAIRMVKAELALAVQARAVEAADEKLIDLLLPLERHADAEAAERFQQSRAKLRSQLNAGMLEEMQVEIASEEKTDTSQLMGMMGMDQLDAGAGGGLSDMFEKMMPKKTTRRKLKVSDARQLLLQTEAERMIDQNAVTALAIERTENSGIVFIDEIDKIAGGGGGQGPDVSRQGVQRDLLPIVEGSAITTKHGIVRTEHILFIAAGAFHNSKPSELMPELQGRFPIRVELSDLTRQDFVRILKEPANSLLQQQIALLATEQVAIEFTDDAIEEMAEFAFNVNKKQLNIGARRLNTILERVVEELSFSASERRGEKHVINAKMIHQRLSKIVADEDRSRYIL
jgi:ATP-dependent HslUV protease ATP-binding subunit HslU